MMETLALIRAQLEEQVRRREELDRKVDITVERLHQASSTVECKGESVRTEQERVSDAKAELDAQQAELLKAQAEIDAAFTKRPARLRFGANENEEVGAGDGSAAIVSTVRGAPPAALKSFILYHLHLGFDAMFLFFDDPHDSGIDIAKACGHDARVHVYPVDDNIHAEWKTCSLWPELQSTVHNNMSRQQLNCELAARRAEEMRIAWIVHIDIDELLDLCAAVHHSRPAGLSPVARHFGAVPEDVAYLAYMNHEAVPEEDGEIEDYFEQVSLFRRNPHDLPGAFSASTGTIDLEAIKREATCLSSENRRHLAGMKLWIDRGAAWLGHPTYFQGYTNGKAAARVTLGLCPSGVHRWGDQPGACQYFDPDVARVLHFSNCGKTPFIQKHSLLLHCTSAYVAEMPFYREVVDALRHGDSELPQDVYRNVVVLSQAELVEEQLRSGTCLRTWPLRELRVSLALDTDWAPISCLNSLD